MVGGVRLESPTYVVHVSAESTPQMTTAFVLELAIELRQRAERLLRDPRAVARFLERLGPGEIVPKSRLAQGRPQEVVHEEPALGVGKLLGLGSEGLVVGQEVGHGDPI